MRKIFGDFNGGRVGFGILVLRLVVGFAFIHHGWDKMQHPTSWMGPTASTHPILQLLATISEFGGGIALVLGLLMPLACFGIFCTMCVAVKTLAVDMHGPWVGAKGSFELPLAYLVCMIVFLCTGPGLYSLDAMLFNRRRHV